ncbi:cytoplasmic tRNA 2-thiolation protein 2 [Sitodiplosis mosellana]|uniref:cytoplasmic tRNA 2-thiolation protein 2 n=1 Tax=Sitodiplosis mosellana TaxID=263140 RepID=UPI002443F8A7|nr:cytoplasmic tRNA 2-thiolation protein 2 [Sitodiplosis mosellana]
MCSIGEDDFGDEGGVHTMQADPKLPASAIVSDEICKKCNEQTVAVKLNLKDAQCESCFFQYVRHKLRAAMGSSKLIERGSKVLLVFDGTFEACVLLDMIHYAVSQEQFKRLTIQPHVVYVDDTCISRRSIDERQAKLDETFRILQHFGIETYYASIASEGATIKAQSLQLNQQEQLAAPEEKFVKKFNAIGNQTAKEDFINVLKMNIYRAVAAQIDCKYVFVPSIGHEVATNLLVNVALGRGKSVANDISFCDNRSNGAAKIIRPMRNISSLEVETYIRLDESLNRLTQNTSYLNVPGQKSVNSIQSLTKQFIDNLQENFASTVSTVFRTGDKISAAAATTQTSELDGDKPKQTCKFCHSDLDYEHSSTLFAIEYSRCVSACADQNEVNDVDLMLKKAEDQVLGGKHDDNTDNLIKSLCHGCRNIFRDLNEPNSYVQ